MKHSTFALLKKGYLGAVDHQQLRSAEMQENDPFVKRLIQLLDNRAEGPVPWDVKRFTTDFTQTSAPRSKLTETVFAFVLRCAAIVKEEAYVRAMRKPESCWSALLAWIALLKECVFSISTLLYDVRWTSEKWIALEETVLKLLHEGDASTLRKFFRNDLGLAFLDDCPPTEAEHSFHTLNFLNVVQFGPFFWRLLHWMAEAIDHRKGSDDNPDVPVAVKTWRKIVTGSLYRMLRCGICMNHLRQLTQELEPQISNEAASWGKLWFNIHNTVNGTRYYSLPPQQPQSMQPYTETEYAKDSEFMRKAFQ